MSKIEIVLASFGKAVMSVDCTTLCVAPSPVIVLCYTVLFCRTEFYVLQLLSRLGI